MDASDILQTLHHVFSYLSEVYTELSGQNAALHVIISHLRKSLDFLALRSVMQEAPPLTPPTAPLTSAASSKRSTGSKIVPSSRPPPLSPPPPTLPPLQMPARYSKAVKQYEDAAKVAWQSIPSLSALSALPSPSLFELQSNLIGSVSDASFEFDKNLWTTYRSNDAQSEAQLLFCAIVAAQRWILDVLKLVSSSSGVPVTSLSASLGISAENLHQLLADLKGSREKLSKMLSEQQSRPGQAEGVGCSTKEEAEVVGKWRDRFIKSISSKSASTRSKLQGTSKPSPSLVPQSLERRRPIGCWLVDSSWMPVLDPASHAPWLPLYPPLASSRFPIKLQCTLNQAISHGRAMHHLQLGLFQLHIEGSIARLLIPPPHDEINLEDEIRVLADRRIALCRLAHLFLVKSSWHRGMRVAEVVVEEEDEV